MEKITNIREGNKIFWSVPKALMENKSASDIMMENGYHPAGYGSPFAGVWTNEIYNFYCWASCD
jgi:hypothetical protein